MVFRGVTGKHCPYKTSLGKVYGKEIGFAQISSVKILLDDILNHICEGKLDNIGMWISESEGLWVEGKGHWTIQEVLADVKNPDGYFQVYFFDQQALNQKKGNSSNFTVQNLFFQAKEIQYEIYANSESELEIHFVFLENPKLARELLNPIFRYKNNRWFLVQMF